MSPYGTQPTVQGSRHTAPIVRHDWRGHRDFDLSELRAYARCVVARAALSGVWRTNALSETCVVSVSFLDMDFIYIHLSQL